MGAVAAIDPLRSLRLSPMLTPMRVFKPKPSAWITLLVICSPMIVDGLLAPLEPGGWAPGLGLAVLCATVVGYNATLRLTLTMDEVRLTRFGPLVWSAPLRGTSLVDGRGGDVAVLPAHVIIRDSARWLHSYIMVRRRGHHNSSPSAAELMSTFHPFLPLSLMAAFDPLRTLARGRCGRNVEPTQC